MFFLSSLMTGIKLASEIGQVVATIGEIAENITDSADGDGEQLGLGLMAAVGLALGSLVDPF